MGHSDVVIIGAGPYGLSIAAHLKAYGVDFRIFGHPMHTWRTHMPKGMHLKSRVLLPLCPIQVPLSRWRLSVRRRAFRTLIPASPCRWRYFRLTESNFRSDSSPIWSKNKWSRSRGLRTASVFSWKVAP